VTIHFQATRGCNLQPPAHRKVQRRGQFALFALLMSLFLSEEMPIPAIAGGPMRMHPGETQQGMASWYGAEQGHRTASGERFNPHAMTAAHRHLPFGTVVRVTNELNGCSCEVRINDRGPWRHGRILDLSEAAATVLKMKRDGAVPVKIEILKLGAPSRKASEG
jgi:rare lipoprotein A (peptidoglycan hydrolase)